MYRSGVRWTSPNVWLGRRVLVTGASGFLGQAVCAVLLEAGAEVHGTHRSRPVPPGVSPHAAHLPQDVDDVFRHARPEVVFHLASPVRLERDPQLYAVLRRGILDAAAAVAHACLESGARLVHVGTCEEVAGGAVPFNEADAATPVSPYSALKAAATHWVMMLTRVSGLQGTVVRPFRAYGPGDRDSLVGAACRAALLGESLDITDGAQVREWNEVHAIAAGLVAAGAHPDALGRVLNLGGGPRLAVREMAARIFQLAGAAPDLLRVGAIPRRPGEVASFWGDHRAAQALWGPLPNPPLDEGLRDTLAWHRSVLGLEEPDDGDPNGALGRSR